MFKSFSASVLLNLVATLVCVTGCYDPDQKFDDFTARDRRLGRPVIEGGGGELPDAGECKRTEGKVKTFLTTISPSVSPDKVSLVKMKITLVDGGNAMSIEAQSYANDRMTLVGEMIPAGPIAVSMTGSFTTDVIELNLAPEANCVLPGTALTTRVKLTGGPVCDDTTFACGTMTGNVVDPPLDLSGSTFSSQEMTGDVVPAPLKNCAKDPVVGTCQ